MNVCAMCSPGSKSQGCTGGDVVYPQKENTPCLHLINNDVLAMTGVFPNSQGTAFLLAFGIAPRQEN